MNMARTYRLLVLGLLTTLVLAACGGASTGGGAATAPAALATSAPAATTAAEATAAPAATTAAEATAAPAATTAAEATTAPAATTAAEATAAPAATTAAEATATGGASGTIKVGSKDFTEEFIVAELYAQLLENAGFTVERKLNLGGTPVAQAALVNGDIDLYPEYTSTGLQTVLKNTDRFTDPKQIITTVRKGYEDQFKLTWLDPSPFNDSNTFVTTKATADKYSLKTFSDLAAKASELRLGGPAEFPDRDDNKAMDKIYGGFIGKFKEFKQLGTGPLRYDALKNGDVDVVVGFGTDGRIKADGDVVLQDDKTGYPIYNIAPVVRQDTLSANPKIADTLNKLAPMLTDEVMSGLNFQVDGPDQKEPAAVAKAFLQQQGLTK
jgi:osmoprotectant transport system substrate-binding protein